MRALRGGGVATQMQHSQSHNILSSESGCSLEFLGSTGSVGDSAKNGISLLPVHVGVSGYDSSSGVGHLQL